MAKSSTQEASDTGNWNVAGVFSLDVIMYHIYYIDRCELAAEFGSIEPGQSGFMNDSEKAIARLEGAEMMLKHLSMLVSSSRFGVKKAADKTRLEALTPRIKKVKIILSLIKSGSEKMNHKENIRYYDIDEESFEKCLEALIKLKEETYDIINNSDMLYTSPDETDPGKLKEMYMAKLTSRG